MKRIILDLMCDLSEYEVTERAQALSSTVVRLDEVEIAKAEEESVIAEKEGE